MPILWRYLLSHYFRVLTLCIGAFITTLLATRFQQIAELATLSPNLHSIALFTLCQIPYILPIAIPIAGLIAAILLLQRLSMTHELTALRSSGLSLKQIHAPLLITALMLSITTLLITSELTPRCRFYSEKLIARVIEQNPLLLIQKSKLLKLRDIHTEMEMKEAGKRAKNLIVAVKDRSKGQLRLLTAKEVAIKDQTLIGKSVSILSHLPNQDSGDFDHLLIENEETMKTDAMQLSELLQRTKKKIAAEHLPLAPLLHALRHTLEPKTKSFYSARFELSRRFFFTAMTFIFTAFGLALGTQIGRQKQKKNLALALLLPALALISSVIAKSIYHYPLLSTLCYLIPLTCALLLSLRLFQKASKGIE